MSMTESRVAFLISMQSSFVSQLFSLDFMWNVITAPCREVNFSISEITWTRWSSCPAMSLVLRYHQSLVIKCQSFILNFESALCLNSLEGGADNYQSYFWPNVKVSDLSDLTQFRLLVTEYFIWKFKTDNVVSNFASYFCRISLSQHISFLILNQNNRT